MSDRDRDGFTRRQLFQGLGAGAVAGALAGAVTGAARGAQGAPPLPAHVVGPGAVVLSLVVNGTPRSLQVEPRITLLDALRDSLGLTGAKPVCDRGACGACTVLLDGKPVVACLVLALDAAGRTVATVEGLAATDGTLSPLQQAFVDHDALQCGYCTPGMLMSCSAVLRAHSDGKAALTVEDVQRGVAGNLCRCGTYPKVFEATLAAAAASGAAPAAAPASRKL